MKKLLIASLLFGSASAYAAPFVVKNIRVDGVQTGSENKVLAGLPIEIGQQINDEDLANVVRSLYARGYDNVKTSRKGNTLILSVSPPSIITEVIIKGNSSIPTDALKANLDNNGFQAGEVLQREKLEEFRKGLLEHYKNTGRYNAEVKTIINNLTNNRVELRLQIKENDVALLKSIAFEGNKKVNRRTLQEQMELQPDAWWKLFGNKFATEQFTRDLETIQNYYAENGFAKARVTSTDVKLNDAQSEARVKVVIDEGDIYKVNNVRIIGNVGGMQAQLAPLLDGIRLQDTFRRSEVATVEQNIKAKLAEQGYATPQVNIHPEFDDVNKTVALTYVVDAGRRYFVRQIRFEGNTVSADKTLRQEMRQQEGAWLSSQAVQLGKLRLERTGFFENVEQRNEIIAGTNDQLDIVYKVKERNTGSINLGVGYGTESGFNYQSSIKQDNFLGMGSSLSLSGRRDNSSTNISLGYNEPYFTKDSVSLGGNIFYEEFDNSRNSNSASYAKTNYGVDTSLGFPVDENNAYYLGVGYIYSKLKNVTPEYSRAKYLRSLNYSSYTFESHDFILKAGWNYNSLNRGYFPTKGVRAGVNANITIPGSRNKFYTLSADATGFYPLDRDHRWVVSAKARTAYASGFGGKLLPFYRNYSTGGIGSIRGFASGSIGPKAIYSGNSCGKDQVPIFCVPSQDVIGGNAMANASLELIVPTPFLADKNQSLVRTSLFVDAGTVWETTWNKKDYPTLPDYADPSRIRSSAGIAFQWLSPIGPLLFSYARPIKKYPDDQGEYFQFSVGGSF